MSSTRLDDAGGHRRRGGVVMAVGGGLLAIGTLLEYVVLGPGAPVGFFVVFIVVFGAAVLVLSSAGPLLASGRWRWANDGLVGDSPLGHLATYAFSGCWLLSVAAYVAYTYVFRASAINYDLVAISTILLGLSVLWGIVAAVSVARARIVRGFSRWSLFVALVCALASGIAIATTESLLVATLAKTITAVVLAVVGVGYALAEER